MKTSRVFLLTFVPTTAGVGALVLKDRPDAALIADVRAGKYRPGSSVVFLHTGGVPAIFAEPEKVLG